MAYKFGSCLPARALSCLGHACPAVKVAGHSSSSVASIQRRCHRAACRGCHISFEGKGAYWPELADDGHREWPVNAECWGGGSKWAPSCGSRCSGRCASHARGFPVVKKDGYLKTRSVGKGTPQLYHNHVEQFEGFCVANNLPARPVEADAAVDRAMEAYFDVLFMEGAGVAKPRYTLWGWAFVHNRDVSKKFFPRARRALRLHAGPTVSPTYRILLRNH